MNENAFRLRRDLDAAMEAPAWPAGFSCRTLLPEDAPEVHRLLQLAYTEGRGVPDYAAWWASLSGDSEFDPALCFLVFDGERQARRRGTLLDQRLPEGSRGPSRSAPSRPRRKPAPAGLFALFGREALPRSTSRSRPATPMPSGSTSALACTAFRFPVDRNRGGTDTLRRLRQLAVRLGQDLEGAQPRLRGRRSAP